MRWGSKNWSKAYPEFQSIRNLFPHTVRVLFEFVRITRYARYIDHLTSKDQWGAIPIKLIRRCAHLLVGVSLPHLTGWQRILGLRCVYSISLRLSSPTFPIRILWLIILTGWKVYVWTNCLFLSPILAGFFSCRYQKTRECLVDYFVSIVSVVFTMMLGKI